MEDSQMHACSVDVSIRILLPNQSSIPLSIKRNSDTTTVFNMLVDKIGLTQEAARYCALFEMIDNVFERKIRPNECPHTIYIQNYSSAASSCILLKKWCFDVKMEEILCEMDLVFKKICFYQAVSDLNTGVLRVKERLYQLKASQTEDRCDEYLRALRPLKSYSETHFPTAEFTTSTKSGLVLITTDFDQLTLQLKYTQSDKVLFDLKSNRTVFLFQEKTAHFDWDSIVDFSLEMDNLSMLIRIQKEGQTEDLLIASDYVSDLNSRQQLTTNTYRPSIFLMFLRASNTNAQRSKTETVTNASLKSLLGTFKQLSAKCLKCVDTSTTFCTI